jgi:dolichol-phosphate mannosyltransferase
MAGLPSQSWLKMQLTVVLPTYNEAENLPKITAALLGLPLPNLKILVVDDNSPDGTGAIADELSARHPGRFSVLHRTGKLGLGSAYLRGFRQALDNGAEAIGQMDADFSHPPEKLTKMLTALETCDMVIGSRYVPGGKLDENWPLWRKMLSAFGNFYARTILRLPIRDTTGGFKLWQRHTLETMHLERVRSNGYAFQIEMNYIACRLGFHAVEIPIYFANRQWGDSKMSFRIQREAAIRVWQFLGEYRDLKPPPEKPGQTKKRCN